MKKKDILITSVCIVFSLLTGVISKDIIIGSSILACSLLNAYYASIGKRINYIFGLITYLLMGYVAYKNNLYGMFILYLLLFSPLQIKGFISWKNNTDENKDVTVREFTFKNSCIITLSCVIGSVIIGYLLSLIPNQRLAFLDSTSNCINLCGVILMILRFKEAWWLWLLNNIIDLTIWVITFITKGENSFMMLLASLGYLLINVYGIIKWSKQAKKK